MDLPDCPPGAEGYEDSVVEKPKKIEGDEVGKCTKAEQEFQDHLNSLKIKLENGEARSMVERRGRDISGKWIYLCYPCAAVCSGEAILQTHISGKKHKTKLAMKNSWPVSIFDDHPFNQNQKGGSTAAAPSPKVLANMAIQVGLHNRSASQLEHKYDKYRNNVCHIQDMLDKLKAPLVGLEYLIEHPPEEPHYEPRYVCTLCTKQGHPRTILNHLTCFWHRYNYLLRHFPKATAKLSEYKTQQKYREASSIMVTRLTQRIEDIYGRLTPVNIDSDEFEKDKDQILQWICKGPHFTEKPDLTFEEVVDVDLIISLYKSADKTNPKDVNIKKKDPSPPVVAAPSKPAYSARRERRVSVASLSDISDDDTKRGDVVKSNPKAIKGRPEARRYEPYPEPRRSPVSAFRSRYTVRNVPEPVKKEEKIIRAPNYEYKVNLATAKREQAEESAKIMLAYHQKNPEKHPLYPEEWKKFWNRRYKEIQAEGKDAAKHDFKPEWIVFWTKRMKELHEEELKQQVLEIYRRLNMPEEMTKLEESSNIDKPDVRRKSPEHRRRSPDRRRRSPEPRPRDRRRSPEPKRRSPEPRRRSPEPRRRSPVPKRRSPVPRRSPDSRRRSPFRILDTRGDRRSPDIRRDFDHKIRVPGSSLKRTRSRSPISSLHSIPRDHRSRSPLSRRDSELRNRSPLSRRDSHRNRSPQRDLAPSMQTVMISDDELRPDDGISPWNSDNDIESVCSLPAPSFAGSSASAVRRREPAPAIAPDLGPQDDVVATLRVLVALEDHLGSLGPKIVDLLTQALKMEKEKANSSEELLERESALVLIETAKEKLKGAVQAGLVPPAAAPAVRAAILRAAGALHEADKRARKRDQGKKAEVTMTSKAEAMPVAGVGEVDRAQIAQQMAAALIAQGKTDVTSEELAQLVDAVIGMAEAKKREAEPQKPALQTVAPKPQTTPKMCGTATALQMLQSAYDENDKKVEKEDAPDSMDGLSDSDLETLLKNFNELSAEEQHNLIAYLKKLEARSPHRVERLRQYVSAAATAAPVQRVESAAPEKPAVVAIESDDDDYTVEEVFQSATLKVKEDQIRKELDIVKKSLEESKEDDIQKNTNPSPLVQIVEPPKNVDISKSLSSASDLFALVQASIKSTATVTPAASSHTSDVVATGFTPRSFGDAPEIRIETVTSTKTIQLAPPVAPPQASFDQQVDSSRQSIQSTFNTNFQNEQYNQNDQYIQNDRFNQNERPVQNEQYNQSRQFNQNEQYNKTHYDDQSHDQWSSNNNVNNIPDNTVMRDQGFNSFDQSGNAPPNQLGQGGWKPNNDWQENSAQPQNWQDNAAPHQNWQENPSQSQNWEGHPAQTPNWQGNQEQIPTWQNNQQPIHYNQQQNQGMQGHNRGTRGNFMNGRNNPSNRPPFDNKNQHFNHNNNIRGRSGGRGNFGGPRIRGRGRY